MAYGSCDHHDILFCEFVFLGRRILHLGPCVYIPIVLINETRTVMSNESSKKSSEQLLYQLFDRMNIVQSIKIQWLP